MGTVKDHHFHIPEETMAVPLTGEAIVGNWWVVHPSDGLTFWFDPGRSGFRVEPSPICNADERVCRLLAERCYPGMDVRQVPVVFLTHAVRRACEIKNERHNPKPVAA